MSEQEISREEEQSGLLTAIENTDICSFWYFPQEKLITINERTARMYSCRREYADMPVSFAEDFVHPATRAFFMRCTAGLTRGKTRPMLHLAALTGRTGVRLLLQQLLMTKQEGR